MTRVTVVSVCLVLLLSSLPANSQIEPICDVTCSPDPGSSTYAATVAARPGLPNARGLSSSIVPRVPRSNSDAGAPQVLAGSESYNYAIPILSLPGRNGLDLNLTLYYNSRIWTVDSVNNTVTFNADRDFPSYGFRLGFGYLEYDALADAYVLTEADGSKRGTSVERSLITATRTRAPTAITGRSRSGWVSSARG
jgi:hypothetical protein